MRLLYLRDVSTLRLDKDACTGCEVCTEVCPRAVLEMRNDRVHIASPDSCIECGACALNCAFDALSVKTGAGCAAGMERSASYSLARKPISRWAIRRRWLV